MSTDVTARADVDTHLTRYPDRIDLACVLATARHEIWTSEVATPARARAIDTVYTATAARFPAHRDRTRPIEQWVHDQLLITAQLQGSIRAAPPVFGRRSGAASAV